MRCVRALRMASWSLALTCALLAAPQAQAQAMRSQLGTPEARQEANQWTAEAEQDYQRGRFEAAIVGYLRAYALVPAPQLLFNLGQCHRRLGRPQRAKPLFEAFVREQPDAPQRALAEQLIEESEQRLRALSPPEAARTTPSSAMPMPRPAHAAIDTGDEPGVHERWWFWTGVVVVAAGAVVATLLVTREPERELPDATLGTVRWQ